MTTAKNSRTINNIIVFWLWNRLMPKAVLNWIRMKKTSEKKKFYYYFFCVCEIFFFYRQFSACFRSFLCRFYASFTILLFQLLRPVSVVTSKRLKRIKGRIVSVVKIYYQKHGLMTMIVLRLLVKSLTNMAIDTFMHAA